MCLVNVCVLVCWTSVICVKYKVKGCDLWFMIYVSSGSRGVTQCLVTSQSPGGRKSFKNPNVRLLFATCTHKIWCKILHTVFLLSCMLLDKVSECHLTNTTVGTESGAAKTQRGEQLSLVTPSGLTLYYLRLLGGCIRFKRNLMKQRMRNAKLNHFYSLSCKNTGSFLPQRWMKCLDPSLRVLWESDLSKSTVLQ